MRSSPFGWTTLQRQGARRLYFPKTNRNPMGSYNRAIAHVERLMASICSAETPRCAAYSQISILLYRNDFMYNSHVNAFVSAQELYNLTHLDRIEIFKWIFLFRLFTFMALRWASTPIRYRQYRFLSSAMACVFLVVWKRRISGDCARRNTNRTNTWQIDDQSFGVKMCRHFYGTIGMHFGAES